MVITTIVFDLGGVLFAEGKATALNTFKEKGLDHKKIGALLSSPLSKDLRNGKVSDEEFWSYAKTQLPENYDVDYIKEEWYNSYTLDEDIKQLIEKLKPNYTTVVFSGTIVSRIEYLENKYHFRKLFDIECYSYDCGHTKPSVDFVRYMIAKAGVPPTEMYYVDDNPEHAEPAKPFGVHVGLYSVNRGFDLSSLIIDMRACGINI